jgi:hypothetical protein
VTWCKPPKPLLQSVTPTTSGFGGQVVSIRSRVRTRPKPSVFSGEKINSMPSFGGEVKPSAPCHRFVACKKTPAIYVEVGIAGKIDRQFIAQFRPSLTEVSHVTWREAPLEMTGGTKGGAQRASSLRPRCIEEVDPKTVPHIYLSNSYHQIKGLLKKL